MPRRTARDDPRLRAGRGRGADLRDGVKGALPLPTRCADEARMGLSKRCDASHLFCRSVRLSRFSNIYRRWWGNEARNNHLLADDEDLVRLGPRRDGVDQRVVDGVLARDLLAGTKDPRVRAAMRLTAAGRSQAEIGDITAVTEKAVERMLYNERVRLKKRMAG